VAGGRHDGLTDVSGMVATQDPGRASCSERCRSSSWDLDAEAALRIGVHRSANRFIISGGAAARAAIAVDFAKNLPRCRVEECA
jgi:hypothetical protein